MSNIGTGIRERRVAKKLTAKELSEKSGVPEKTIYRIETGEVQDPKISSIVPLVKYLDCTLDELILGKEQQPLSSQLYTYFERLGMLEQSYQERILDALELMRMGCDMESAIKELPGLKYQRLKIKGENNNKIVGE